jgi:hypothetical protein
VWPASFLSGRWGPTRWGSAGTRGLAPEKIPRRFASAKAPLLRVGFCGAAPFITVFAWRVLPSLESLLARRLHLVLVGEFADAPNIDGAPLTLRLAGREAVRDFRTRRRIVGMRSHLADGGRLRSEIAV